MKISHQQVRSYVFISELQACHDGFKLVEGDISGGGIAQYSNVPSTNDCGEKCNNNPSCKAYQWSANEKGCFLHAVSEPDAAAYPGWITCQRGK